MSQLTDETLRLATPVLERYRAELLQTRAMHAASLEKDLRDAWSTGYGEIKVFMIAMADHGRYQEVAAYYMEHANAPGVVAEFKDPLAKLYGVKSYHHSPELELKRDQFWARAFAGT